MHDDDLRRALERVDPPEGFADRILQHALASPKQSKAGQAGGAKAGATPIKWAIAATLVLATLGGGGVWYRAEERRKEQGEEAKRQVLVSLRIAGGKLKSIETRINREEH
jgi:hypothetical protein